MSQKRNTRKDRNERLIFMVLIMALCTAIIITVLHMKRQQDITETPQQTAVLTTEPAALLTEALTEPETDLPTEPPTEPTTEEPTEPTTEEPTDPPDESYKLVLVNRWNPLPENYDFELLTLSNGISVDERIYPDLQDMFDACRADGLTPIVGEGYRTHAEQQQMMDSYIAKYEAQGMGAEEARQKAEEYVALPGTSEHELGLALDINSTDGDSWGVYSWLAENAYQYGFILRYPEGKEGITGIDYEPWHYRYVGKEAAEEIHSRGITLEEYLQ